MLVEVVSQAPPADTPPRAGQMKDSSMCRLRIEIQPAYAARDDAKLYDTREDKLCLVYRSPRRLRATSLYKVPIQASFSRTEVIFTPYQVLKEAERRHDSFEQCRRRAFK